MSQIDAHSVDGPQSNQFRSPDAHSATPSTLASDWVDVLDVSQPPAVANARYTEQDSEECSQSSLTLCDSEDPLTGAVIVGTFSDCDQCALASPMAGVQAPTKVSEMRVSAKEDQTFADCACAPCIGRPDIDDDARSESSDASFDMPSCVAEYFEYEREAFVNDERLVELDMEYNVSQEISERDRGLDGGLPAAFEESEKIYRRKRQELSEALAIAHYRLFVRRNACIAQGLDPESFRYRHY